jgi:arsenate reductase (thioredoxin)
MDRSLVKDRARPLVAVILLLMSCAHARHETVLFVCPHGGAKSLIAASYFNRMAAEGKLPFTAIAVAAEDPYENVPAPIADLLATEGFDVRAFKPRSVSSADLFGASKVVSVGCNLTKLDTRGVGLEDWNDVPLVSDDLRASAAAIRKHVAALIDQIGRR